MMNTKKSVVVAQAEVGQKPVAEVSAPVLTLVKDEVSGNPAGIQVPVHEVKEEVRRLSLEERIQRVEDLTFIGRFRALTESRRKLQTFQIVADSFSSSILLRDASGNEFKTSNSSVITTVIEEMKRTLDTKVREVETQINF